MVPPILEKPSMRQSAIGVTVEYHKQFETGNIFEKAELMEGHCTYYSGKFP